jgi:hypothetical protein
VKLLFQTPKALELFFPQPLLKSLCTTSLQRMWRLPCNLIAIFRSRFEQEIFAGQARFGVRSVRAQRCKGDENMATQTTARTTRVVASTAESGFSDCRIEQVSRGESSAIDSGYRCCPTFR